MSPGKPKPVAAKVKAIVQKLVPAETAVPLRLDDSLEFVPKRIQELYEVHEWRHASAILRSVHPQEWSEILHVLENFRLKRSYIFDKGGGKSKAAIALDSGLIDEFGWEARGFDTRFVVDGKEFRSPTHEVDVFKNRVGVEMEWNNKDPFYDRDLNNFRLLFDLRVIDVGVIITRCTELEELRKEIRGKGFGASTTHMEKLLPKVEGGGAGGCPIIVFGIRRLLYVDDSGEAAVSEGDQAEDDED